MWFCLIRVVVFSYVVNCEVKFNKKAELEWDSMSKTRKVSSSFLPKVFRSAMFSDNDFLMLPDYVVASSATDQKSLFKPEMGARPLPNSVKFLMFPTTTVAPTNPIEPEVVELLCHIDRIYVRIRRDIFKTVDAYKYLKLGTCAVNHGTPTHYYLMYFLTSNCSFTKESNMDHLTIKNVLHYQPTTRFLRDLPFDVPIQCNYQRLFHSYKVGTRPKLQGGTLFKSLRRKRPILLIPQNESGNAMTRPYVMGESVFFEARRGDGAQSSADERLYINKCFITPSIIPSGSPAYIIIDNYGCMVDGKESAESRFLSGVSTMTQRFTMNAVILTELASTSSSIKPLYMHCDVSVGNMAPSEGFKACNYDEVTQSWKELYGDDLVCACCDTSCSPPPQTRALSKMVTSQPWKVDLEDELKIKSLDANFGFEEDLTDELSEWDNY